jgi:hypothetical protein
MLKFNPAWRFDTPGSVSPGLVSAFADLIGKVATQGNRQGLLEHFKTYFASAAGSTASWSSSESWADSDLQNYMGQAAANAPLFIEAFYDACETLRRDDSNIAVPDVNLINRVLTKHEIGYEVCPPDLVTRSSAVAVISVPERPASLDEEAQEIIQRSLSEAEKFLSEGRDRQAVQEILWLLETVSTAFHGLDTGTGSVEGKYFNKIVGDLRRQNQGTTLDQVLGWLTTLHGYLSSPTGGGIRHGTHLKDGVATKPNEARLFCNLIRSYISFLLVEHERLSRTAG